MAERELPKPEDLKPLVNGNATLKKPGLDRKFKNVFLSENAGSVGDYLLNDVVFPTLKNMWLQGLHGAIDVLFGNGTRSSYDKPSSNYSYGKNRGSYARRLRYDDDIYEPRRRSRREELEIILPRGATRGDAMEIRDTLIEMIDQYGKISVSHLNSLVGISDRDYTDNDWGWDRIGSCEIRTLYDYYGGGEDGYLMILPPPKPWREI